MYSPHDSALACTPLHTGLFLDYDHEAFEHAWLILVDGEISSYSRKWWKIKLVEKNYEEKERLVEKQTFA